MGAEEGKQPHANTRSRSTGVEGRGNLLTHTTALVHVYVTLRVYMFVVCTCMGPDRRPLCKCVRLQYVSEYMRQEGRSYDRIAMTWAPVEPLASLANGIMLDASPTHPDSDGMISACIPNFFIVLTMARSPSGLGYPGGLLLHLGVDYGAAEPLEDCVGEVD